MLKDYLTKNSSFLDTVKRYHDKDLDDKAFCLTLLDTDLLGVDPYNENLTDEMKEKIIKECENNIWYFLREVLKVKTITGDYNNVILNIANASAIWQSINSIDTYLISPRQTCRKHLFSALALWYSAFKGQDVVIFCNDLMYSEKVYKVIDSFKVPEYIDINKNRDKLIVYPKDTGILDELLQCNIQIFLQFNSLHYLRYVSNKVETKYKDKRPELMGEDIPCFRLFVYGGMYDYGEVNTVDTNIDFKDKMIDSIEDEGFMIGRDGVSVSKLIYSREDIGLGDDWYKAVCEHLNNDAIAISKEIDVKNQNDTEM